jgi:hypothetical protein
MVTIVGPPADRGMCRPPWIGNTGRVSDERDDRWREAQETIEVARRVHPANHPDAEAIAEFHELHATHEREHGRLDRAHEAERRAARARRLA